MSQTQKIPPAEIEQQSMAIIDAEVPFPPFPPGQWPVVRRMIHASADFELLSLVRFHPLAMDRAAEALGRGCRIVTDTRMARAGITEARMQALDCRVTCVLDLPDLAEKAARLGITRSALGMQKAAAGREPAIFVIGNAPTALFSLLDLMRRDVVRPAVIIGMPVGFVGAAESKEDLVQIQDTPWITVSGRKGGSPLAAACVNALAELALQGRNT